MKITALLFLAAVWPVVACGQGASASLENSEVRISYGELKRLLAATHPPPPPEPRKPVPPVAAALISSRYLVKGAEGTIVAELEVENFDGGWHAVPVAGAGMAASTVEPKEARLVVKEGQLCLVTDKAGGSRLTLSFPIPLSNEATVVKVAPAALNCLEVAEAPKGKSLWISHDGGSRVVQAGSSVALPAAGGEVTLLLEGETEDPTLKPVMANAGIARAVTYATEVVRDGMVLTEGTVVVHHEAPSQLRLLLPKGALPLQCHVNGEALSLAPQGDLLEIPLQDPATDGAESEIKLSYTQQLNALEAAEGEVTLALPQMAAFARVIDWNIRMPEGFDLAVAGNVEAVTDGAAPTAPKGGELRLRKALCRDQQPLARITYRRR